MTPKAGWYKKVDHKGQGEATEADIRWVPCMVHAFVSEHRSYAVGASVRAVAVVEDEKTGDVLTVFVSDVRFANPLNRGK